MPYDNAFELTSNIIYQSLTKCKRVTYSVLVSEIYGITRGFDLGYVLTYTLNSIFKKLSLLEIPLVICTDSYSLYQCFVQLGTTNEKRLIIDIMALYQAYKAREIYEIRQIYSDDNLVDVMTKARLNRALESLVSTNKTWIRLEGWVQRAGKEEEKQGIGQFFVTTRVWKNSEARNWWFDLQQFLFGLARLALLLLSASCKCGKYKLQAMEKNLASAVVRAYCRLHRLPLTATIHDYDPVRSIPFHVLPCLLITRL